MRAVPAIRHRFVAHQDVTAGPSIPMNGPRISPDDHLTHPSHLHWLRAAISSRAHAARYPRRTARQTREPGVDRCLVSDLRPGPLAMDRNWRLRSPRHPCQRRAPLAAHAP